uniref:Uncharacterized protein n=1 Tax=Arundo donax TaxID=35708 RepID=A0A0A9A5P4_ARUDO
MEVMMMIMRRRRMKVLWLHVGNLKWPDQIEQLQVQLVCTI